MQVLQIIRTGAGKGLKGIYTFAFEYIDYLIFFILITFKLVLFESFIGASFLDRNFFEYLKVGFNAALYNHDFFPFHQGIYLASIGSVLLVSFWTLLLKRPYRWIAFLAIDIVLSFIIISDLVYYRYYGDLISIPVLLQAFQVKAVGDSIANLFEAKDVLFIIELVVFIPLLFFLFVKKRINSFIPSHFIARLAAASLVLILGYFAVANSMNVKVKSWGEDFLRINWWNICVYNATGLLGFHGYDAYNYFKDYVFNEYKVPDEEKENVKQWFDQHNNLVLGETPYFGAARGKNLIVIQAEALQSFLINREINGKEITPNLNALIKDSMYFKNFYHQTDQGTTSDAELLTQCSLYPLPAGSAYIRYGGNHYDGLPGRLKESGYSTAAFHANDASFWNRYTVYGNIGFQRFFSKSDYIIDDVLGLGLSDQSFFNQSVVKLKDMKRPFYAFMITLSSHYPFNYEYNCSDLDLGALKGTGYGGYIESIHYADKSLGNMVELLKEEGLWEETVFVVYGDHDTKLPDKGELNILLGRRVSDIESEQIKGKVPLIIHLPGNRFAGEYKQAAGQIDLAPTLLHLLGVQTGNLFMMGNNMLNNKDNLVVFRNGAFTNGNIFFIPSNDQIFEHGRCYDTVSGKEKKTADCKEEYEKALKQLMVSDNVITGNIIKELGSSQ